MNHTFRKMMALAMIGTMMAGCGSTATSTADSGSTAKSKSEQTEEKKEDAAAPAEETAAESGEKVLRIGELWAVEGIDPVGHDATLCKEKLMIIETLTEADENFRLIGGLAESWENADENTWIFNLREGVKFHDGTDMDAEAVKWSLDYAFENDPTHVTKCFVDEITVTGDYQITVHTSKPYAELPEYFHEASLGIFAKSSIDENGDFIQGALIGTGPFKLESFDVATGTVTTLKNEEYWGTPTTLDKVVLVGLNDANSRALALENNEVDFTCDLPFNQIEYLNSLDNCYVESYDTARLYQANLNLKRSFFADKEVRQAVSYGIDRETIANETLFGAASPAKGIYTDNMAWANTEIAGYAYDPDKATEMLEKAGWKDTNNDGTIDKDGEEFKFTIYTYPDRPGLPLIAEAIQAQLKPLGIGVDIITEDYSAISKDIEDGKEWGMYLSGNATCMIPSCFNYLDKQFSSSSNAYGYKNDKVDELLAKCASEYDTEKRYEISKEIQAVIMDDLPVMEICNYGVSYGFNSKVSNFKFNPTAHDYMFNTDITVE